MTQQDSKAISIVALMVAVIALASVFLSNYSQTLQTYKATTVPDVLVSEIDYYKNTIVIRNKTKDGVRVELYIKANVEIKNVTNFNTIYDEMHSILLTTPFSKHSGLKIKIYDKIKNIVNAPDDITIYFHTTTPKGKDHE